jgi:hypothetical protein
MAGPAWCREDATAAIAAGKTTTTRVSSGEHVVTETMSQISNISNDGIL